jgi:hypothetical protein
MDAWTEVEKLRNLCPLAELMTEGGQTAVYMPGVQFQAGTARVTRDLLLWPAPRDGYLTRLFLSQKVTGSVGRAWTAFTLCGRSWWAVSWQGVPANLPWIEVLANHLRAFQ